MPGRLTLSIGISNIGQISVLVDKGEISISVEPSTEERK